MIMDRSQTLCDPDEFPSQILYIAIGSLYFSAKVNENIFTSFKDFQSRQTKSLKRLLEIVCLPESDYVWDEGWYFQLEKAIFQEIGFRSRMLTPCDASYCFLTIAMKMHLTSQESSTFDFQLLIIVSTKLTYLCLQSNLSLTI